MKIRGKFMFLGGLPISAILILLIVGFVGFHQIRNAVVEANTIQSDQTTMVDADRDGYQAFLAISDAVSSDQSQNLDELYNDFRTNADQTYERIVEPGRRFSSEMDDEFENFLSIYENWNNHSETVFSLLRETLQSNRELAESTTQAQQWFLSMRDILDRVGVELAESQSVDGRFVSDSLREISVPLVLNADRDAYQALFALTSIMEAKTLDELSLLNDDWLENTRQTRERFTQAIAVMGMSDLALLSDFELAFSQWQSQGNQAFSLLESTLEKNQLIEDEFQASGEEFLLLHDSVDNLRLIQDQRVADVLDGLYLLIQRITGVYLAIAVIASIGTIAIIVLTSRGIIKAVVSSMKFADSIADGDLNVKLDVSQRDELGMLAASLSRMVDVLGAKAKILDKISSGDLRSEVELASENDMLGQSLKVMDQSLNKLIGNTAIVSSELSEGAEQIAQASQSLSQGAAEQAQAIMGINHAIQELGDRSRENTETASSGQEKASSASKNAVSGQKHMEGLIDIMAKINASSDAINSVVKLVDDISFQINLLALNANVEAARAGKYGKGFGVVADEVSRLADRSAESVREISQMVQQTVENIRTGDEAAKTTAGHLDSIVEDTQVMVGLMKKIARLSEEQSSMVKDINESVNQIDSVIQANTASSEQTAAASEELSSQAVELTNVVNYFKLKTGSNTLMIGSNER